MTTVLGVLAGFLIGGIPFGYLVGRIILKDDIRKHGSGNIGATNVARTIGWKWGSLVLLLDALKGLIPTLIAQNWLASMGEGRQVATLTGLAAIFGHMYPIYLRLRGGKGVATGLGVVLVLAPKSVVIAFAVFLMIAVTTRLIALASIAASLTFMGSQFWLYGEHLFNAKNWSLGIFSVVVPLLIIWRHRSNIVRLVTGKEPTVTDAVDTQEKSDLDE